MIFDPNVPVGWTFDGDIDAAKVVAPRARKIIMECVQQLNREYPWIRRDLKGPGWSIQVNAGFGAIRVRVYAEPKPKAKEPDGDPHAEGRINWQARGFVLTPATAANASWGFDTSEESKGDPVTGGFFGWVLLSQYDANYPDDIFRRKLGLDKIDPPPPTETQYRTLLRMNRVINPVDLEEYDRRDDGTKPELTDETPPKKNLYRPGIQYAGKFTAQYGKDFTELTADFTPQKKVWAAHWPTPVTPNKFTQGCLEKSNAYRLDAGKPPVFPPLKGWSDDLAALAVKGMVASRGFGHNMVPAPGLTEPFKGARKGFQWANDRVRATGSNAGGENTLVYYTGVKSTLAGGILAATGWRYSPPHYANMIDDLWSGGDPDDKTYRLIPLADPEAITELVHEKTNRNDRGIMSANTVEAELSSKYREEGPPYEGVINMETLGKQYASQVFTMPEPAPVFVSQGLMRPISYPYRANRIWAECAGAGPVPAHHALGYSGGENSSVKVIIHGHEHTVMNADSGYVAGNHHLVLAAGYRTDENTGEMFIRAVVYVEGAAGFVVNPAPAPGQNQYAWGAPTDGSLHFKVDSTKTMKVVVTETPLVFGHPLAEGRPAKYLARSKLIKTLDLPPNTQTIYGAAVAKDGTKEAVLFSCITTKDYAVSGSIPDIDAGKLGAEPITFAERPNKLKYPCMEYGEVVLVYEGLGAGSFIEKSRHSVTVDFEYTFTTGSDGSPSTVDVYDASTKCAGTTPLGVLYDADGYLRFALQEVSAESVAVRDERPAGTVSEGLSKGSKQELRTTIVFPNGDRMDTLSEDLNNELGPDAVPADGGVPGYSMRRMLMFCDWYKPEDTVFMSAFADKDGMRLAIGCGVRNERALKRLDTLPFGTNPGWTPAHDPTPVWMSYSQGDTEVGASANAAAFTSEYREDYADGFAPGGTTSCYTVVPGYSVAAEGRPSDDFSAQGLAALCGFSVFAPTTCKQARYYASAERAFNHFSYLFPAYHTSPAQVGTVFYVVAGGASLDVAVLMGGTDIAGVDESVGDRRNSFATIALDGDAIVEGLWMHSMRPGKYDGPGYFRSSTIDIESALGVDAKFTLPFGVIE